MVTSLDGFNQKLNVKRKPLSNIHDKTLQFYLHKSITQAYPLRKKNHNAAFLREMSHSFQSSSLIFIRREQSQGRHMAD